MYSPESSYTVYCSECWFSDRWDPLSYGRKYDFNQPFFEQFKLLLSKVPRRAIEAYQNENTPYSNYTWFSKNVYMSPTTIYSEDVFYSRRNYYCADIIDCFTGEHLEKCYEVVNGDHNARSTYLFNSRDCVDSHFLFDCAGCTNCFMSSNLRNKSYVFQNRQLTREEYKTALERIRLGSFVVREDLKKEFDALIRNSLHRYAMIYQAHNATGDVSRNVKNAHYCFDVTDSEDIRYFFQGLFVKDGMDLYGAGDRGELLYEGVNVGYQDSGIFFSADTYEGMQNAWYCNYCLGSRNIFGCVGIRKKEYCILNTQYTKEEYAALFSKIKEQMQKVPYRDAQGRYYGFGEFMPFELSPYAYNETLAQEFFPLTEKAAAEQGYRWRSESSHDHVATLRLADLPDDIDDTKEDILDHVIECAHRGTCAEQCTRAFRIIRDELAFYKNMKLPLPRLCPNCRHYARLRRRNPYQLWHRKCTCAGLKSENKTYSNTTKHFHGPNSCPNEFETAYASDRPEVVYCEQCYQAEVI